MRLHYIYSRTGNLVQLRTKHAFLVFFSVLPSDLQETLDVLYHVTWLRTKHGICLTQLRSNRTTHYKLTSADLIANVPTDVNVKQSSTPDFRDCTPPAGINASTY
jgi:hypothetical protein